MLLPRASRSSRAPVTFTGWRLVRGALTGVPPAFIVLLGLVTLVGEVGEGLRWRFLTSAADSRVVLGGLVLVVVVGTMASSVAVSRQHPGADLGGRAWWLACAPGMLMLAYATLGQVLPLHRRAEWFLGGDHVRHLVFTAQEAATGNLDYRVNTYPRAWHTLVALVWSATGGHRDAGGLLSLVGLLSTGSWCVYALLTLATGQAARALALRCGLTTAGAGRAGLAAGAITLWPSFLSQYMALGFENSILAGVVIAVSAREVLGRAHGVRAVIVCAAGVAVMANAWQLLLPAPAVALVVVALGAWKGGGVRARVSTVLAICLSAAVAAPGLVAVTGVGIGHAADVGVVGTLPVVVLPLAFASAVVVGWRCRHDRRVLAVTAMVSITAVSAAVLAVTLGIPVTQYYPSKVLWNAAALALMPLGVVVAIGVDAVWRLSGTGAVQFRSVVIAVAGLGLAACGLNPSFALVSWATVDGRRVLTTLTSPGAADAQVVWLPRRLDDSTIARILLDYYRVGRGEPFLPQQALSVAQECDLLARQQAPAVLSSATAAAVRERYACVPAIRVVPARIP